MTLLTLSPSDDVAITLIDHPGGAPAGHKVALHAVSAGALIR